jgi:hypothetical protein
MLYLGMKLFPLCVLVLTSQCEACDLQSRHIFPTESSPQSFFPREWRLEFLNAGYVRFRLHLYITAQVDGPAWASIAPLIVGQQTGKSVRHARTTEIEHNNWDALPMVLVRFLGNTHELWGSSFELQVLPSTAWKQRSVKPKWIWKGDGPEQGVLNFASLVIYKIENIPRSHA